MSGPLWDTKQRQGHALHRICAFQGSFPPQLPAYFLDHYPGVVVLDPFCGRGTTLLEAVLRGRTAWGFDLLATARVLSAVKIQCCARQQVIAEIDALDLTKLDAPAVPTEFEDLYHWRTWAELWNLRMSPKSMTLAALALGRMHGHSPGFFSGFAHNVICFRPASLKSQREKHGSELPYKDVKAILKKAAKRFVPQEGLAGAGIVQKADARQLPIPEASVDLVITSPPFLDVIDYPDVNWVREWFLGEPDRTKESPFIFPDKDEYARFIRQVLTELKRVVKVGGTVVFEVGPVKKETNMSAIVVEAAAGLFQVGGIVVNSFSAEELKKQGKKSVPKISRAMGKGKKAGKETTTTANQCVVMFRT